ncbi:MAG TPA: hypothetical protein VHX16_14115 [Chloroflexota bacterium]|nr:hypothetical protein [Chloroflexota bacterium]
MQPDESLNYKMDSGIEALARGAVGATVGMILGIGVGFAPVLGSMLGIASPLARDTQPISMVIWLVTSVGLGALIGATYYLKQK